MNEQEHAEKKFREWVAKATPETLNVMREIMETYEALSADPVRQDAFVAGLRSHLAEPQEERLPAPIVL